MNRSKWCLPIIAGAVAVLALPALAAPPVADVSLGTMQVEWQPTGEFAGMKLRVSGPLGVVEQEFGAGENPLFDLRSMESVADGLYTWEVVAAPRLDEGVRRAMAESRTAADGGEGRQSSAPTDAASLVQSGTFRVVGGAILQPTTEAEPSPTVRRVTSEATGGDLRRVTAEDQVINDDLIVTGSLCVGFDCVNGETFGFDTIRMKENNTRIKFDDTSTAGGFPSTDWQLTANDSASGGANKFSIEDITTARVPFTIRGGATTNSIFVDSTGRVGFRTSTPVLDLHIATSNTPGIRLEQTNAGGFTAQTWDIAGNEANFFVRDVTGGSRLPFRIRPGAPTSSIDVAASGNVGIGTTSPSASLHVRRADGTSGALVEEASTTAAGRSLLTLRNNGQLSFSLDRTDGTAGTWSFTHNGGQFNISKAGTGNNELAVFDNGNVEARGTITGNIASPSSRALKQGFSPVDQMTVLSRVRELPIFEWSYLRDDPSKVHIGPIAEDFTAAFQVGEPDKIFLVDANGVALAAIQGLSRVVDEKEAEIIALRDRLQSLEQQVQQLLTQPN